MSNMSYCRFENTCGDFFACIDSLENFDKLSESEAHYAELIFKYAERYIDAFEAWREDKEEKEGE